MTSRPLQRIDVQLAAGRDNGILAPMTNRKIWQDQIGGVQPSHSAGRSSQWPCAA